MSKELTPLEAFKNISNYLADDTKKEYKNELKIIKKALKEKEQQDCVLKTLKEVIELGKTLPQIKPNKNNGFDMLYAVGLHIQRDIQNEERKQLRDWILKTCFPKELKALEIIKKKQVNMYYLLSVKSVEDYNEIIDMKYATYENFYLTQEEFDLLKDQLK